MPSDTEEGVVEESVEISAPPARVWEALVVAESRSGWWSYLDLDPVVGGQVKEVWEGPEGATQTTGVITALVDGELLRMDWADEGWTASAQVEFTLRPAGNGTLVRLRETGLDRVDADGGLAAEHRAGWQMHLRNLRAYLERH